MNEFGSSGFPPNRVVRVMGSSYFRQVILNTVRNTTKYVTITFWITIDTEVCEVMGCLCSELKLAVFNVPTCFLYTYTSSIGRRQRQQQTWFYPAVR